MSRRRATGGSNRTIQVSSNLKKGYFPADIKDMIKQNGEMDANYSMLNEAFGFPDVGDADEEDVHVLVDMPEYAKKDLLFFRYN
ncbi:unnamed protein product, partial [Aphanomyces euteiches]